MARGGGSARLGWLGADLLEGRLLLSHATSDATGRILGSTPVHVASTPAAPRPEAEPGRTAVAPSDNAEAREADEIAAAAAAAASSVASRSGVTIPLLASEKSRDHGDDSSESGQGVLDSARYLRVAYREEPIAWRLAAGGGLEVGPVSRHRADKTLEIPESGPNVVEVAQLGRVPGLSPAPVEGVETLPSPEGSDLLADFLPSDRVAIDRAIDGLLDGFEELGEDISRGVESTTLVPSPVVWGFTLAVLEVIRRRLRRRSRKPEAGDLDPDRDPGDGFLAFLG
jgi:hypothetical protein